MDGFYTIKGYQRAEGGELTAAMEDYLEMMSRIERAGGEIRVGALARALHVKPSSATRMCAHLAESGYVEQERYGAITLTDKGRESGEYLLRRHETLRRFLSLLNRTDDVLELTEKLEHSLDRATTENLERLCDALEKSGIWG